MHRMTIQYATPVEPESFNQHYGDVHLPMVEKLPGLRRIVTSHTRGVGSDAPYMVTELWFDDRQALKAALNSPEMREAMQDAQTFEVASTTTHTGDVIERVYES